MLLLGATSDSCCDSCCDHTTAIAIATADSITTETTQALVTDNGGTLLHMYCFEYDLWSIVLTERPSLASELGYKLA